MAIPNTGIKRNQLIDLAKIKTLCSHKKISYAELGRRIGLPMREQISRRLQNSYKISADEIFLIADELGVSPNELRLNSK